MISRKERQHMRKRLDDPEYRLWLVRRWRWCSVALLPPLLWIAAWAQRQASGAVWSRPPDDEGKGA